MLKEAYRLYSELGDVYRIVVTLCRFARLLTLERKVETAARVLSSSEVLLQDLGARRSWVSNMNDETLTAIRAQLDEAAFAEAWEQGKALTADEALALALGSID
ncbi:MAG: hypothetical protein A2Y55_05060 [Actinobacteria bacterium RBG_16_68_12]|nr:MAG: hypothetical protein A2Y55_05060 [Actinobacteria bacterium RBG_16_68_12]